MPEPSDTPAAESSPRQPRRTAWRLRAVLLAALLGCFALGAWHVNKPLPPGLRVASAWQPIASTDLRLLTDTTAADAYGRPVVRQEIFDEQFRVIAAARKFIVVDAFLFNDQRGALDAGIAPLRPLSRELRDALIAAKTATPSLAMLVISDPINNLYGAQPSNDFALLRAAGINVVTTDLDQLRDSNPIYSAPWHLLLSWWSGQDQGEGWLPNPLDNGPSRVTLRAWARLLNFKANHRKVLIADDGASQWVGIVGSANPHDASSAHSNIAVEIRGAAALQPLLQSELAIARFSRGNIPIIVPEDIFSPPGKPGQVDSQIRVITEGAIRDAVLGRIRSAQRGDAIDIAQFYLSEREIIKSLLEASSRGVAIRLLLDPNKDAFGHEKSGIPNRSVASELVSQSDGAIKVRWFRTHGEQFHSKMMLVRTRERLWLALGSANFTRRNVADYNLEADVAIETPLKSQFALQAERYFDALWNNIAPPGVEYSADFAVYTDPAQASYWVYRLLESTGMSTF